VDEVDEVLINELIGLDTSTMVIEDFPDPYITCCWIDEYRLFVNLFHPDTQSHYHFIYDICYKKMEGIPMSGQKHDRPVQVKLNFDSKNFPYKCFFDPADKVVHSFYRQGNSFRINVEILTDFQ
jgi:hypothetical protein